MGGSGLLQVAGPSSRSGAERLVERTAALGIVARTLAAAQEGHGSILTFEGHDGLGKSSLLRHAIASATPHMIVLDARGRDPEQDFAYAVLLQLFEGLVADRRESNGDAWSDGTRIAQPLFDSEPSEITDDQAFSVFHGLYRLCSSVAADRPLLIVVDDADLADAPSLRFLLYLAERIQDVPVALALAVGSGLRCVESTVLHQVTSHPVGTTLRLRPLGPEGTARCLRESHFPDADSYFCDAVHHAAAGNPLLVHELARLLGEMDIAPARASCALVAGFGPPSLSAATLARIRPLGEAAALLLRAAAVLGDSADLRLATELAGLEQGVAAAAADGLVGVGLLEGAERLTFVHPVIRRAVEADQAPAARAEGHRRAAQLLAEEDAPAEVVAAHLLESSRGASGWVVDALTDAARQAVVRGHPDQAIRYLTRALEEPPSRSRRAQVLLDLGHAEAAAGDPRAVDRLNEAAERLADPVERARTALETGHMLFALGRHEDAARTFAQRLDELQTELSEVGGQLDAALVAVSRFQAIMSGIPARGDRPPECADTPADRAELAYLALEAALRGDPRQAVRDMAERALDRGALLDDTAGDGIAYYLAAVALALAEDLQMAEIALTTALEEARSRRSGLGVATASSFRSLAILRRGRVVDAAADARAALAAEQQGWRVGNSGARFVLVDALLELDEIDAAEQQVGERARRGGESTLATALSLASRGRLALAKGDARSAHAAFTDCGALLESLGVTGPALVPWRGGAGRAAALLGDREQGAELVAAELELAERFGAPGVIGQSLRALAAVHGGDAAVEVLEEAVQITEPSQAALERARALVEFGAALRRSGRRRDAREPLRRGLVLAQRCGAVALVRFAKSEIGAAGARPRRTALRGPESLTAREHEVARLAARGASNREIAEALFVTVKTVEWHLKNAYRKLGVESRQALPAAMSEIKEDPARR